jgi:S1-C subfamily serine protease
MSRGRSLPLLATVVVTLAIVAALAWWYRMGPRGTPAPLRAAVSQRPSGGAGWLSQVPHAAPAVGAPASESPTTGAVAAADSVVAEDADQRQLTKITRGMSSAPAGGILVTGTPPGSVTGQLRLREGDVIVSVNGEAVSTPDEFARIYREQGVPRQLTILRDGREIHRH